MEAVSYRGLGFRKENKHGWHWMVNKTGRLFSPDELSKLEMTMLERNKVPHLLQLDIQWTNSEAELMYRLPPGRNVQQLLQAGQADWKLVLELLHSLVLILEDSRTYMLDESKYALHPGLITVGEGVHNLHLLYLPVTGLERHLSVRQELYQLTLQMIDWAKLSPSAYPVLLDCLKSSLFELGEFKKLLVFLQTGLGAEGRPEWRSSIPAGVGQVHSEEEGKRESFNPIAPPPLASEPAPTPSGQGAYGHAAAFEEMKGERLLNDGDTMRFPTEGLRRSSGPSLYIALTLAIGSWGMAAWFQTEWSIWAAAVGTLLAWLLHRIMKGRMASEDEEQDVWPNEEQLRQEAAIRRQSQPPEGNRAPVIPEPASAEPVRTFQWTEERQKLYADSPAQTVLLAQLQDSPQQGETELLLPRTELLIPEAVIDLITDGQVAASMKINRNRFAFGRSPEETDFVLSGRGISRVHAEIVREEGEWVIRDLGSRNGSRLNGKPLTPHEPYPLQHEDRITAAETELVFRVPSRS